MSALQKSPPPGSKKLSTPALMSCLSAAPQNHNLFFMIGPPYSTEYTLMRLIGLPDRKPFDPRLKSSSLTLLPCVLSFSNVVTAEPLNALLPLLVTRLIDRPDDCTVT